MKSPVSPPLDGAVFTYIEVACELFERRGSWLLALGSELDMVQPSYLGGAVWSPSFHLAQETV